MYKYNFSKLQSNVSSSKFPKIASPSFKSSKLIKSASPKPSKIKSISNPRNNKNLHRKPTNIIRPKSIIKTPKPVKRSRGIKPRELGRKVDENPIRKLKGSGRSKILVIVANGHSKDSVDLPQLLGKPKIDLLTINKPDKRIWPTDLWMFCDNSQLRRHRNIWESYNGIIINTSSIREVKPKTVRIRSVGGNGFSRNLIKGLHIGRTTTYAAMQVASWCQYEKIFLFGVDMCKVDGKLYSYGSNPDVDDATRIRRFKNEAKSYDWAANKMSDKERSKYYFCSSHNPFSFVKKFNKLSEKDAVKFILECEAKL